MTDSSTVIPGSYAELRMWAEAFADAQDVRVAFQNKARSGVVDTEGFAAPVKLYEQAEANLGRSMVAAYRATVPETVRQWQANSAGVGEGTLARLLGITGDPRMAYPKQWEGEGTERHLVEGAPFRREVGQLWQFCGIGAEKNREVKGNAAALMANGSPDAKKLCFLLAQAQVKSNAKGGTAYRHVYDQVKAKYAERVHRSECKGGFFNALYVKCKTGPNKAYAQAGDPFQPSHIAATALRITAKEILRDLWLTAGGDAPSYGAYLGSGHHMGDHRERRRQ